MNSGSHSPSEHHGAFRRVFPPATVRSPTGTVVVVVNPVSGRGRGRRALAAFQAAAQAHGRRVVPLTTEGPKHAVALVADVLAPGEPLGEQIERLVVIGGDGTINEAVTGLAHAGRFDVPLAFIPMGTGNVLGHEFGVPRRFSRALPIALGTTTAALDRVRVEPGANEVNSSASRLMLAVGGVGLCARAVHECAAARTGPMRQRDYVPLVWRLARRRDYPALTVVIDGTTHTTEARWVIFANTAAYGGPLRFAPHALPGDGWLDVVVFMRQPGERLVRLATRLATRSLARDPAVAYLRGRAVRVFPTGASGQAAGTESAAAAPLQIDGDPAGHAPVALRLDPAAPLTVHCAPKAARRLARHPAQPPAP